MSAKVFELSNYPLAGVASMGATFFTNPLEVIKTRLQLQGELQKRNAHVQLYRGVLHAFYQVAKHDGINGLQKGLVPAFGFQFCLNSVRLGVFDTVSRLGWNKDKDGNMMFWRSYLAGGITGAMGSCLGSPFFLVKTHMQSYSPTDVAVGFQRNHQSMSSAFWKIYSVRGMRGLYRGVIGNIPRAVLGSGAQLATFEPLKEYLERNNLSLPNRFLNVFACSTIAGSTMAVAITPPDVILTRLYNQPLDDAGKGKYYKGFFDCMVKVVRIEGVQALYKGFWPNYLRVAPHSTLVLLFYDYSKQLRDAWLA